MDFIRMPNPQTISVPLSSLSPTKPFLIEAEGVGVAVFLVDGVPYALSDTCAHRGGPISQGTLSQKENSTFVQCPWHGWEYDVKTGKAPEGYGDTIETFPCTIEKDQVIVSLTPKTQSKRAHGLHAKAQDLLDQSNAALKKRTNGPLRIMGISATNMSEFSPRKSTSEYALEKALETAQTKYGAETKLFKLREMNIRACEGYYSKSKFACTFPCSITEQDEKDEMAAVYLNMLAWADVVLIATPIRWGNASSLLYKMVERLNSIQNQIAVQRKYLVKNKVAGFIVTGGQDGVQKVAGEMMMFFTELGFAMPKFSFIGWSRGWYAEDMENNPIAQAKSNEFHEDLNKLVSNTVVLANLLIENPNEFPKMVR